MRHFQEALMNCMVTDLPYTGALFTRWNKREEDLIGKKLNIALVNSEWLLQYPLSSAYFDAGRVSDHALFERGVSRMLLESLYGFLTISLNIKTSYQRLSKSVTPHKVFFHSRTALLQFHKKLKLLNQPLHILNRTHYGDLPARTKQA